MRARHAQHGNQEGCGYGRRNLGAIGNKFDRKVKKGGVKKEEDGPNGVGEKNITRATRGMGGKK